MDRNQRIAKPFREQFKVALRKESVDRNFHYNLNLPSSPMSLSARRAWIEISSSLDDILAGVVALRKESVDRNCMSPIDVLAVSAVALRKESVDRNTFPGFGMEINGVALRKESVDRNREYCSNT